MQILLNLSSPTKRFSLPDKHKNTKYKKNVSLTDEQINEIKAKASNHSKELLAFEYKTSLHHIKTILAK